MLKLDLIHTGDRMGLIGLANGVNDDVGGAARSRFRVLAPDAARGDRRLALPLIVKLLAQTA